MGLPEISILLSSKYGMIKIIQVIRMQKLHFQWPSFPHTHASQIIINHSNNKQNIKKQAHSMG